MSWRVVPGRSTVECESQNNKRYKVIAVPDGDTVLISRGPHRQAREWLRLLCVDAPEHGQTGFHGARDFLRELILEKWITIEPEKLWKWRRGKYGRTLVYVFIEGVLVNAEIVRQGWSDYWTRYGRGRYQTIFQRCIAHAIEFRKGVWEYYQKNDCWRWGRGRSKAHFRTAQEVIEKVKAWNEKKGLKNGKVSTDFGSIEGCYIGDRVLAEQRGSVRERKGCTE